MKKRKQSDKQKLVARFWKFLVEEDVFVEYREAIKKQRPGTLKSFFRLHHPKQWFTYAFGWYYEGVEIEWVKIAIKWDDVAAKFIEDNNLKIDLK